MKRADDSPVVIRTGEPQSGAMTNLGALGAIGSGLVGLGSWGANSLARHLDTSLGRINPYLPGSTSHIERFNKAMSTARRPADLLSSYVQHGSTLMGQPIFRGGMTGRDVMYQLYAHPILSAITRPFTDSQGWNPGRAQHYGEFAKGPIAATQQLAREIFGKNPDALLNPVRNDLISEARTQANQQRIKLQQRISAGQTEQARIGDELGKRVADFEAKNRPAVNYRIERIENRLRRRGALGAEQSIWDSPWQRVQHYHDQLDTLKNQAISPLVQSQGAIGDKLQRLQGRLAAIPQPEASADRLISAAIKRHGDAPSAAVGLALQRLNNQTSIAHLLPDQQIGLIGRYLKTPHGDDFARRFASAWESPIGKYKTLGTTIMAPERGINTTSSLLKRFASGSRRLGGKSLLGLGGSLGLYGLGRTLDSRNQTNSDARLASLFAEAHKRIQETQPQVAQQTQRPISGDLRALLSRLWAERGNLA